MRIAFSIQYNGAEYCGFQRQKSSPSIQFCLEKVFSKILKYSIFLFCAGRTDSGVHALAQVIHIDILEDCNFAVAYKKSSFSDEYLNNFIYSCNALLPFDISIMHGQLVSDLFHARFSCFKREYSYTIINSPFKTIRSRKSALWIRKKLNIEWIKESIPLFIGEKDFASLTRNKYVQTGVSTIRRIHNIDIQINGYLLEIRILGSGFLHNMNRILVGILVDVGLGKLKKQEVLQILESKDRRLAGRTLPAHPLVFRRAFYQEYKTPDWVLLMSLF